MKKVAALAPRVCAHLEGYEGIRLRHKVKEEADEMLKPVEIEIEALERVNWKRGGNDDLPLLRNQLADVVTGFEQKLEAIMQSCEWEVKEEEYYRFEDDTVEEIEDDREGKKRKRFDSDGTRSEIDDDSIDSDEEWPYPPCTKALKL